MPALTLGTGAAGTIARFTRSAMLEVLDQPYMRRPAGKGVPRHRRVIRHALPNAAIPVVTVIGLNLGGLVGGAVVVETVFAWPGVGRLLVTAVTSRDLAVVQALVLVWRSTMVARQPRGRPALCAARSAHPHARREPRAMRASPDVLAGPSRILAGGRC